MTTNPKSPEAIAEELAKHPMTPLEEARHVSAILREYGIRPTDHHKHVGQNAVRCEFCKLPVNAKLHDPERLGRGEGIPVSDAL